MFGRQTFRDFEAIFERRFDGVAQARQLHGCPARREPLVFRLFLRGRGIRAGFALVALPMLTAAAFRAPR